MLHPSSLRYSIADRRPSAYDERITTRADGSNEPRPRSVFPSVLILLPFALRLADGLVAFEGKGTLTGTEWANELHPKPRGFNKVARVCWGPAFAAAGLL